MPFVSVTRLRVRAARFLPRFAVLAIRSRNQACRAAGFRVGSLLADRRWTFWTVTVWDDRDRMRDYMLDGSHRTAMPRLLDWCDEASVVHWTQDDDSLPTWQEADRRMRTEGRPSKVRNPGPNHCALAYDAPRVGVIGSLKPATKSA